AVQALIYRGLAKHPAGRPPGALEFAEELEVAATAAYVPEWESNGWRRLAEVAAGLVALFPLAALAAGTVPGAAGHLGGAAAGKAAAATGRGVLTKIFGTNAAAKVVAVATGLIVVGSATTAAIVVSHHQSKKPKPATASVRVELASYTQSIAGLDLRDAHYAHVRGVRDATAQRKIDQALFAPLEWSIAEMRKQNAEANPPCTKPTILHSRPEIGMSGPHLASVQYALPATFCSPLDYQLPRVNINVDLRTGKALTADDVFRPETLSPSGLATLVKRVSAHVTQQRDLYSVCVRTPLPHEDFYPGEPLLTSRPQPPRISPFFTAKGVVMSWSHAGSECPYYGITLPYSEARDLLNPQIAAELPR
ncbi:MAG TPA: hypothetical protein VE198_24190, partial [Actinoallomurus sp.]|nr:hypothetical protein [Actinoallomurus sp.]